MGQAASRMSLAASGQSQDLEGRVTITATEAFAVWILPDIVAELQDVCKIERAPSMEGRRMTMVVAPLAK